jgi:hypothetical protein
MHQPDQQGTPPDAMLVIVILMAMGPVTPEGRARVTMGVQVRCVIAMPVGMKVDAVPPQAPQHVNTENDEDSANCGLEARRSQKIA